MKAAREELNLHPESFSMRKVASKAHIAVGTIYHYYPDKINLIASILLEDWRNQYDLILADMKNSKNLTDVLNEVIRLINAYRIKNSDIFRLYKGKEMNMDFPKLHEMFVSEIMKLFQEGKKVLVLPLEDEKDLMISEMILIQAKSKSISFETLAKMVADLI